MKLSITKSRAGHYTVTIRDNSKTVIFKQRYITTIVRARAIAQEFTK